MRRATILLLTVPLALGAAPSPATEAERGNRGSGVRSSDIRQVELCGQRADPTASTSVAGAKNSAAVTSDLSGQAAEFRGAARQVELVSFRQNPAQLARRILDESLDRAERERVIRDHPELSAELLEAMTADLQPGTEEEYRRIPWIWQVAMAAGRRNGAEEIGAILKLSLPEPDLPLRDWQAVVIGGGIINGISQSGAWPGQRVEEILQRDPDLLARWRRALELASRMADNHDVRIPTRYDALRMIGLDTWERRGAQLLGYLAEGVEEELQMGAISALGDMQEPQAAEALLSGIGRYSERNRNIALDALMRSEGRQEKLLDALEAGRVSRSALGEERLEALENSESEQIRSRAKRLLR